MSGEIAHIIGVDLTETATAEFDRINLEHRVVEAAIKYVQGVGYDGNSLQQEHEAAQRFVDNYNTFMRATRALIAERGKKS